MGRKLWNLTWVGLESSHQRGISGLLLQRLLAGDDGTLVLVLGGTADVGNAGVHKVNVLGNLSRQTVLVGANALRVSGGMGVDMILGLEDRLELAGGRLKMDPALASGDLDGAVWDARGDQPVFDGLDRVLFGGEELDELLLAVVVAVVGRVGVRAASIPSVNIVLQD